MTATLLRTAQGLLWPTQCVGCGTWDEVVCPACAALARRPPVLGLLEDAPRAGDSIPLIASGAYEGGAPLDPPRGEALARIRRERLPRGGRLHPRPRTRGRHRPPGGGGSSLGSSVVGPSRAPELEAAAGRNPGDGLPRERRRARPRLREWRLRPRRRRDRREDRRPFAGRQGRGGAKTGSRGDHAGPGSAARSGQDHPRRRRHHDRRDPAGTRAGVRGSPGRGRSRAGGRVKGSAPSYDAHHVLG